MKKRLAHLGFEHRDAGGDGWKTNLLTYGAQLIEI